MSYVLTPISPNEPERPFAVRAIHSGSTRNSNSTPSNIWYSTFHTVVLLERSSSSNREKERRKEGGGGGGGGGGSGG
ncbi:hypothetical protein M0804_002669 [Polistes exclamans]|nr:hypothetical protein M0804_002669 [Polistes exclamans]